MKKSFSPADPFIATRQHHLSELGEDYVEYISELFSHKGEAKICDLAKHFAVSHVTVIRAIERLKKKGYLESLPDNKIGLSKEGIRLAAFCKKRHQFLLDYLIALGVPKEIAAVDVEGMEHHVSPTTMAAMRSHLAHINLKE